MPSTSPFPGANVCGKKKQKRNRRQDQLHLYGFSPKPTDNAQ